jgi:hypothetical protein
MGATILPRPGTGTVRYRGISRAVAIALSAWFVLIVSLGAGGAFVARPGTPPLLMAVAVAAPLLVFWAWMQLSHSFRAFVLSLDLRVIVGIQAWRWAGLGFIDLYAYHVLPAVFALPAGLGDMAVGLTAPWMIFALVRHPGFAASAAFIRWNLLGILDLLVAITIGTLSATFATGAPGDINTAPMATLPLLLIPAFLVPLFLMLHAAALLQSRQL